MAGSPACEADGAAASGTDGARQATLGRFAGGLCPRKRFYLEAADAAGPKTAVRTENRDRRRAARQREHIVYLAALLAFLAAAFLIIQERG